MNYVHPPNKTSYYKHVWSLVRQIPRGQVATYGQLTKMVPQPDGVSDDDYQTSAARWVGLAMAACSSDVPWHRVVNSQGKISHRTEGAKQKQLLGDEGVLFSKDKIDLNQYQWQGPGQSTAPRQGQLF